MSERMERDRGSREREKVATPKPDSPDLAAWIEDKFQDGEFPQFLQLKVAHGRDAWREATIHQEEIKPAAKTPERADFVRMANKLLSAAQNCANSQGKSMLFVILAINTTKSASAYGMFHQRMRPIIPGGIPDAESSQDVDGDAEILPDAVHRDQLLRHNLQHLQQADENTRWQMDNLHRATGDVMKIQQQMIQDQREHIRFLEGQRLEAFKAVEASLSQKEEREMKREAHQFKLGLMQHGFQFLKQMVPVVVKTLDKNKDQPQLASGQITDTPESIAVREFVNGLSVEQKTALFGSFDDKGNHSPGIFSLDQARIIGAVLELKATASALDALWSDGSPYKITDAQQAKVQEHVPMDQLSPLFFLLMERQRQAIPAPIPSPPEQSAPAGA
jgi:hypothetical protein